MGDGPGQLDGGAWLQLPLPLQLPPPPPPSTVAGVAGSGAAVGGTVCTEAPSSGSVRSKSEIGGEMGVEVGRGVDDATAPNRLLQAVPYAPPPPPLEFTEDEITPSPSRSGSAAAGAAGAAVPAAAAAVPLLHLL